MKGEQAEGEAVGSGDFDRRCRCGGRRGLLLRAVDPLLPPGGDDLCRFVFAPNFDIDAPTLETAEDSRSESFCGEHQGPLFGFALVGRFGERCRAI